MRKPFRLENIFILQAALIYDYPLYKILRFFNVMFMMFICCFFFLYYLTTGLPSSWWPRLQSQMLRVRIPLRSNINMLNINVCAQVVDVVVYHARHGTSIYLLHLGLIQLGSKVPRNYNIILFSVRCFLCMFSSGRLPGDKMIMMMFIAVLWVPERNNISYYNYLTPIILLPYPADIDVI